MLPINSSHSKTAFKLKYGKSAQGGTCQLEIAGEFQNLSSFDLIFDPFYKLVLLAVPKRTQTKFYEMKQGKRCFVLLNLSVQNWL